MLSNIGVNDLVEFTENCTALGAARCRANKIPGKVIGIVEGRSMIYLVDAGLGYSIYAGINDIKPFKSCPKREQVHLDKEEAVCKV